MTQFETAKTYWARSACDHDCIFSITVLRRTAKTIVVKKGDGEKSLRITVRDCAESVKPHGSYSMAAIISADKVAA